MTDGQSETCAANGPHADQEQHDRERALAFLRQFFDMRLSIRDWENKMAAYIRDAEAWRDLQESRICVRCDICKAKTAAAVDDDDRWWCVHCILKWQEEHKQNWATGQPLPQPPEEE